MAIQPEIQGVSIVLRGHLNPAIFHPSWFGAHGLIRSQEAQEAETPSKVVVTPDLAAFEVEWLRVHVTTDRFEATTAQESYYEALRDLVVGVFGLLNHTPLTAMGLNREFHFRLRSRDARDSLGHRLAPIGDWETVLQKPGMQSLTMQGERPDGLDGYVRAKLEPSARVDPGIYVDVNDHYQLKQGEGASPGAGEAMRILTSQWTASMERGYRIALAIASIGDSHGRQ